MEPEPLDQELSDQDRVLLVFGYLGPLALVALIASRREFVKWHAKQGLALWLSVFVLYPLLAFVKFLLDRYALEVLGAMFAVAVGMMLMGALVMALVCIVRGLEGERFKLPLIGDAADRL